MSRSSMPRSRPGDRPRDRPAGRGRTAAWALFVLLLFVAPLAIGSAAAQVGPNGEPVVRTFETEAGAHVYRYEVAGGTYSLLIGPQPGEVLRGEAVEVMILAGFTDPPFEPSTTRLQVYAPAANGWNVTLSHREIESGRRGIGGAELLVRAETTTKETEVTAHIEIEVHNATGAPILYDTLPVALQLRGEELILGTWENPFPAPLDNAWGIFLGNAVAWLVIAGLTALLVDPTMRMLTARTKTNVDDRIIHILRVPVFLALFAFGVKQSLDAFVLPVWAFAIVDHLYRVLLVVAIVYASYRIWQEVVLIIGKRLARRTETQLDDRLLPVFEKIGGFIIIVVGLFYLLDSFGLNMTVFAAGGAVTSLVIAFAAQDTLSNFFSGIFLMLDQPFKEGDDIILDTGEVCEVTRIGLRTTDLYHRANHETIVVPNNLLATNRTINLLKPDNRYKVRVDIGVAYGTNVQQVKDILLDIVKSHPLTLTDDDHQPFVRFQNFGASSLDFSVHGWVGDVYSRWAVASDLREMIDERFAEAGIEIPFPQRVIWQGREEADRAAAERANSPNPFLAEASTERKAHLTRTHDEARGAVGATGETGGADLGSEDGGGDGDV